MHVYRVQGTFRALQRVPGRFSKKKKKKERKEEKKVKKRKSRGRVSFEKEDDDVIYEFRTLSLLEASTNYYYYY